MEEKITKIVELDIDLNDIELDDMGVEVVSLVTEPAIEVDFLAFNKEQFVEPKAGESEDEFIGRCIPVLISEGYDQDQAAAICYASFDTDTSNLEPYIDQLDPREEFESYNDYPEAARNNAQRAIDWAEEHGWGDCGTDVGKQRAHQLAKGENISRDTIARMASFARHEQWKDVPYSEGCGGLMWDAWGGSAGINWAKSKLRKIEEEMILEWAEEHGEQITEEYTVIKEGEEFASVSDIASAIQGLDILGKLGVRQNEPAEIKYRYTGPSAERGFCKAMLSLNRLYAEGDMRALRGRLSSINPGMGPRGRNSYNVFAYKGGVNCRHFWTKNAIFKPEGSRRVLVIDQGPADGDAGKSNNANSPSSTGSVRNNASLRFGFSVMDQEKRIVAGPLMIANQMILRRNENGEPYYVYFSKETIRKIQERFNKEHKINNTDTQHDGNVHTDNVLLEQWIIEHPSYDKSKFYGFDRLPLGSWFGVYKINNDEDWERVKSGELRGFSVAGNFLEKAKPVNEDEATLNEIIKILRNTNE
jgi:hypothetical protein